MASKRVEGITIKIEADATPLNKAIKSVNQSISKTQSGLRDINKLLKMDPRSTELLTQKQKALSDAINQTKDKLSTLKDAAEKANDALKSGEMKQEQYDALQREIIETEQNLKQLEQQARQSASVLGTQFQESGRKIQEVGEKIGALGDRIAAAGSSLTMKVTAPIVAAAGVAVAKFADVDKTMVLTNQTMGNTTEQAEMLNAAMEEAAANSTFGMNDAANATLNFARAGLSAEQAASALAPAMNLAAGEGGDLGTVSAGLVATINGFQDSFENASQYADIFAAACNNSALDVNTLSDSMSVAAPVFKAAGYSVEDAALYMGVMANNGIDANTAANALKTGMAKLAKPAKEGAEALDALGVELFNADGSMKDSLTVQKLLHDSFATLSEQEQIAAASAIFGKNQMSNWLALINTAPGDVDDLSSSLEDCAGTTHDMADAMMGGFGGSIEKLKSSLDVLMTSLGKLVAKYLTPLIEKIQKWIDKFQDLSDEEKDQIVRIAGIVAAIGPALLIVGKVISAIGKVVNGFGTMVTTIGKVMTAIKGMSAAMAAANIVLVAAAAAAAALIAAHIKHRQEVERTIEETTKLTDEQNELIDSAKASAEAFDEQTESMKRMIAEVDSQYISEQHLIDELNGIVDANGRVKQGYEERAQVIAGQLAESFGVEISYQDGVIQKYDEVMAKIDEVILKKKAEMLQTQMAAQVSEAQINQSKYWNEYATALDELRGESDQLEAAQRELTDAVATLNQYEADGYESNSMLSGVYREQKQHVLDLKETVDKQSESVKAMEQAVADAEDAYYQSQSTIRNYDDLLKAMESGSIPQIEQAVENMSNNLMRSGEASTDTLKRQAEEANTAYQQMLDAAENGNAQISDKALQDAADFAARAQKEFDKATEMAKGQGENFTTGYADGMDYQAAYAKAEECADQSVKAVQTRLDSHSPSEVMKGIGNDFVEGLALGIEERTDRLIEVSEKVKEALLSAFNGDQMQMGAKAGATATSGMAGKGGKGGGAGNNQQAGFFSTLLPQFDTMLTMFEEKILALQEQITTWLNEFTTLETTWFDETWFVNIEAQCQQVEDKLTEHVENLKTLQTDTWTEAQTATDTNFGLLYSTTETKLDEIYNKFDEVMTKLKTDAVTWGEDVVQGLIDGIDNMMPTLQAKCEAIAAMIASYIHFSLPDKGPLSDMDESMPDMINMMVKGIDQNMPKLAAANARIAQALAPDMSGVANMSKSTNSMNNRLDVLTDVVARYLPLAAKDRQVVLYPNKLVGALAPGMNRALGGMMA